MVDSAPSQISQREAIVLIIIATLFVIITSFIIPAYTSDGFTPYEECIGCNTHGFVNRDLSPEVPGNASSVTFPSPSFVDTMSQWMPPKERARAAETNLFFSQLNGSEGFTSGNEMTHMRPAYMTGIAAPTLPFADDNITTDLQGDLPTRPGDYYSSDFIGTGQGSFPPDIRYDESAGRPRGADYANAPGTFAGSWSPGAYLPYDFAPGHCNVFSDIRQGRVHTKINTTSSLNR